MANVDIEVRSSGVKKAEADLDRLAATSGKLDKNFNRMSQSSNKAGDSINRVGGSGGKAHGPLDRLGKKIVVGTGAVLGMAAAFASLGLVIGVLAKTAKQEEAIAQLDAVLESTKSAAGLAKDELLSMASALQEVTKFGDETIIGAENLLLTFTKIGRDVFPSALEAVLNMSTALKVDLKTSATQLGRALQDPIQGITALRRAGVGFSPAQQAVIKALVETGRVADAQVLILRELEVEFGNSARAARDTLGGALDGLKNAFGDLLEGDAGAPGGVSGVKDGLERLTALLSKPSTKAAFAELTQIVLTTAEGMIKATVAVSKFFGLINETKSETLSNQIQDIDIEVSKLFKTMEGATKGPSRFPTQSGLVEFQKTQARAEIEALQDRRKALVIEQGRLTKVVGVEDTAFKIPELSGALPEGNALLSKKGKKSSGDSNAASTLKKQADDLDRLLKQQGESAAGFRKELISLQAELDGPLAVAQEKHSARLADLLQKGREGKVSDQELTEAKRILTEQYNLERNEIERTLHPAQQLLEELRFEASLIGLTNVEREKAITLRGLGVSATAKEAEEIGKLITQIEAARDDGKAAFQELINAAEGFGSKATDAFVDFAFGAKISFKDLVNEILKDIARLIIKKNVVNPLVNAFTSGLSPGGFIGSIFGNRAIGGGVSAGQGYRVAERNQAEVFIPHTAGRIEPLGQSIVANITINASGSSLTDNPTELAKGLEATFRNFVQREKRDGGLLARGSR